MVTTTWSESHREGQRSCTLRPNCREITCCRHLLKGIDLCDGRRSSEIRTFRLAARLKTAHIKPSPTHSRRKLPLAEPKREQLKVEQQRAVLVAVLDKSRKISKERALDELRGLVKTAGVTVVGTLVQQLDHPNAATCLGSGKVEELKRLVDATGATLVVFDNNLPPSQTRALEKEVNKVIVDRSEVILDIFASRARTYESRLQVELAQLLYFRSRLKRMWTHLERIEGGVGSAKGPGEKQIEMDRRIIGKKIVELKKKLAEVQKRREREVALRRDSLTVSLVGYTNAGKSTLMNCLTGADVYVADKLFATLDTRTRRWHLPHWGEVLLSDTVGFVRDLPHDLVASFKSTLEEARHADLLLHVVDASDPEAEQQIATVNAVLEEVGVDCKEPILVLNKIDACEDRSIVDVLRAKYPGSVIISATERIGVEQLERAVAERLADGYVQAEVDTPAGNGRLLSWLQSHTEVVKIDYVDSRAIIHCRVPRPSLGKLHDDDTRVTIHDPLWENGGNGKPVDNWQPPVRESHAEAV